MRMKEMSLENIFGDLDRKIIRSDSPTLEIGDEITITNANCELEFDSIDGTFEKDLIYAYIVELELIETDLSNFEPTKSNDSGSCAFAKCKVCKIIKESY